MRVLVLWSHHESRNLGVRVLAEGTAALVRRAIPDADVVFQDYGKGEAPRGFSTPRSVLREAVTRKHGTTRWLKGFDLIIDTRAGDSFTDIYGIGRQRLMTVVGEYARWSGVPVVLGPQTIGPFGTRQSRALARRSLRSAACVMSRDSVSSTVAGSLGRPADVETTDVVFALPRPERRRDRDVVLNISGLLWNSDSHLAADRYRSAVIDLHRGLVDRGRHVDLLAHVLDSALVDNDVPAIREFAAVHAPEAEVIVPDSLDEARSALAGAALVFGSRMHACLNAMSVGTPAIPLAYSDKFAPLLKDLGWAHTVDLRSGGDPAASALAIMDRHNLPAEIGAVRDVAECGLQSAVQAVRALV